MVDRICKIPYNGTIKYKSILKGEKMKKSIKNIIFVLAFVLLLPCMAVFTGCKPKETGFYVVFDNVKLTNENNSVFVDKGNANEIEDKIEVYSTVKKKADKLVEKENYSVSSTKPETVDYGDTFTITVSYKKFKDFVINVNINKLKNEVTLSATSKTYNGEPFKVEDLGISANVNAGLAVEWYLGETKLASAPVNAGKYRVKIHIDSTKEYEKVDKFFDVEILKAEPIVDWTLVSVSGTHLSTDKVSTIVLPEGFSWKNPDMLLGVGTSTHTIVYTPEDTNYKAVEKDFEISAKQAFFLPTQKELRFTGETIELCERTLVGFDENFMEVKNGEDIPLQTNAGTYKVKIGLKAGVDACWFDGTTEDKDFSFVILKKQIKVPYYKTNYALMPLTGSLTLTWDNIDERFCYLSYYAADGNSITFNSPVLTSVTYCLNNSANCEWEDGTTDDKHQVLDIQRDAFEQIKYTPFGEAERIITTEELMEIKNVCVGSVFEFVLKNTSHILKVDDKVVSSGRVVAYTNLHKLDIRVYENEDDSLALFGRDIPIYMYATSVKIDGKEEYIDLIENDFYVNLKENQTTITVELAKELENFELTLVTIDYDDNYKYIPFTGLTVTVQNVDKIKGFVIMENSSEMSVVEIYVIGFTRIDHFVANRVGDGYEYESEVDFTFGDYSYVSGIINRFDVVLKDGYKHLTYEFVDRKGNKFTSFADLNDKEYFYVLIKDGDTVLEKAEVMYDFIGDFSYAGQANDLKGNLDYFAVYAQVSDLANLEENVKSYKSQVQIVVNGGQPVSFDKMGLYKVPISFTYTIKEDFIVTYSTTLVVNYSKKVSDFAESSTIPYTSIFMKRGSDISWDSSNRGYGCGLANIRVLLTNSAFDLGNFTVKEGYTLKSIKVVITDELLFGYEIIFDNNGQDEVCFVYEPVSGTYDGVTSFEKIVVESYVSEKKEYKTDGDTFTITDLDAFKFVSFYPTNDELICKITDEEGNVVYADCLQSLGHFAVSFKNAGTYKMTVYAPNGASKIYTLIVSGDNLGKPVAKVVAGTGENQVELEERFEEVDGYEDFVGDFVVGGDEDQTIFIGYFGEKMLSETKTIKGKEYLDVSVESILIANMTVDKDGKVALKTGTNTLEVKVDENEAKYVEFYVIMRVYGQTNKIRCMIYLADSPDAGE